MINLDGDEIFTISIDSNIREVTIDGDVVFERIVESGSVNGTIDVYDGEAVTGKGFRFEVQGSSSTSDDSTSVFVEVVAYLNGTEIDSQNEIAQGVSPQAFTLITADEITFDQLEATVDAQDGSDGTYEYSYLI